MKSKKIFKFREKNGKNNYALWQNCKWKNNLCK